MGKTFNTGDKVRVCADWITGKTLIVTIVGFQKNGNETFAKVKWHGTDAIVNAEQYGTLFTLKELRKA